MPDDSYQLIDKDSMEPSILLRKLRPWRREDADRAQSLVHDVLAAYERNAWRCEPFKWETSVCPLFCFIKDQDPDMTNKAVYERVFDWAGHPSDGIDEDPPLKAMLGPAAVGEVDLLIESANYFIFIEAKVLRKPDDKAKFPPNKKKYWAIHQLVRQFVQGRLLAGQISKEFMLATLGASDEDSVKVELSECDRRLLNAVGQSGQDFPFPDMPNFGWAVLSLETD